MPLLILGIISIFGYCANLWKAVSGFLSVEHVADVTTLVIVQSVGVFIPPLGAIFGWVLW